MAAAPKITVNRAPVLTLWAAIVAEHLGYDPDTAIALGRAVGREPLPLAEREAARTVGALIARERASARPGATARPRLALLRRLADPIPRARALPFRRAGRLPTGAWPIPARLPLLRPAVPLPPSPPATEAGAPC